LWERPSQLRQRIALLIDDRLVVLRECASRWRLASLATCGLLAVALSFVTVSPVHTQPTAVQPTTTTTSTEEENANQPSEVALVVAQHALLLDGKQIVTWADVDKKLGAMPNLSQGYLECFFTNGVFGTKQYDESKAQLWKLHKKYNLKGHSEGSLSPRTAPRYDKIRTPADLVPDESLRLEGKVVGGDDQPVAGAEVVLITPVDESISYKTYDIALVEGRLRNRLDEIVTDADATGGFALYPPKGLKYYVLALHPEFGISIVDNVTLANEPKVSLVPWASLETELQPQPGAVQQTVSLRTRLRENNGYPEIVFCQYWSDLNRNDSTNVFRYSHVPSIYDTSVSRDFIEDDGGMMSTPMVSVSLLPGESRRVTIGPLSEKQQEYLKAIKQIERPGKPQPADDATKEGNSASSRGVRAVTAVDERPADEGEQPTNSDDGAGTEVNIVPEHFVRLVAGPNNALTFEGDDVAWDELAARLKKVPNRPKTVLEFAISTEDLSVRQVQQLRNRAFSFSNELGFLYFSYVGVHPLKSKGTAPPQVKLAQVVTQISATAAGGKRPPALLSYGDGKADGKKSYGGSGHMIRFELPEGVTHARGLRIHGSRYGLPQAPDENFEITFLNEDRDEVLHSEEAPYHLFKRGKENWVRVMFDKEVELPPKFWIALNFNPHQTKGVYLSYDTSTKGQYSRVGLPGDDEEPKETDFGGDWMVQVMLPRPKAE
jgi:RNA polymerase sigma-70 factor (ECF subfamily)